MHCSEAAAPFAAVSCFSFMYPAGSGDGASEMSDETPAVLPVTVAKRYRKQTSQTGSDDFVCIVEQSGLEEVQTSPALGPAVASSDEPSDLLLGPVLPPSSFTAAQSDSQVVATPAPACSPLQILDGDGDLTLEAGDAHTGVTDKTWFNIISGFPFSNRTPFLLFWMMSLFSCIHFSILLPLPWMQPLVRQVLGLGALHCRMLWCKQSLL